MTELNKQIELIFSTVEKDVVSSLIRWVQRCPYSHVEAYHSEAGMIIGSRNNYGVGLFNVGSLSKTKYEVKTIQCAEEQYEKFFEFLYAELGKKYDWHAYIGFLLNRKRKESPDKWLCSEIIVAALEYAGIHIFEETPNFLTPRDIYIHPICQKTNIRLERAK